jgi:hypothetical protein
MLGKIANSKIKASKSEAIYDVLNRLIECSSNHYEKEAFVYHHSVVSHNIKKYKLKMCKSSNVEWSFIISENEVLQFKCKDGTSMDAFLQFTALKNKANNLINYILKE